MKVRISTLRERLSERQTAYVLKKIGIVNRKRDSVTLMQFIENLPVMDWYRVLPCFNGDGKWFRLYLCEVTNDIKESLASISDGDNKFADVHAASVRYAYGELCNSDLLKVRSTLHDRIATVQGLMYDMMNYDYTRSYQHENAIINLRIALIVHAKREKEQEIINAFKPFDASALDMLYKILNDMHDLFLMKAEEKMKNHMMYAASCLMNGIDPYPDL